MITIVEYKYAIFKLSVKSLSLSFTPYPLFQWYLQSNEILWNLSMKCWNSNI
jgi:hypothetical protein